MMVQTGAADCVLAGGVESMSNIEYYTTALRGGTRAGNVALYDRLERGRERSQPVERFGVISGMIETAENVARVRDATSDVYAAIAMPGRLRPGLEAILTPRWCPSPSRSVKATRWWWPGTKASARRHGGFPG